MATSRPLPTLSDWKNRAYHVDLDRLRFLDAADRAHDTPRHGNDAHATYIGEQRRAFMLLADAAEVYRAHCEAVIADLQAHAAGAP